MAVVPPPGVRGSKVAERRVIADLATCSMAGAKTDPAAGLSERVKSCASVSKLTAKSPAFAGEISDTGAAQSHAFRAESGRCYRVYFASSATDAVVTVRDEAGDDVGESATGAAPSDGLFCWKTAGNVTLSVAAGTGKGRYAVQVYGD